MLFNSYLFIFLFLPIVVTVYYLVRNRIGYRWAISWIVLASFFYYAWWKPILLLLLLTSISVNFAFAKAILNGDSSKIQQKWLLGLGIAFNLCVLGYFKYAAFFVQNVDSLFSKHFLIPQIVLPIGISFITFQKIAFLVDIYRGELCRLSLQNYMFFVTFFPQLIAGPIVHHQELIPQLEKPQTRVISDDLSVGFSIFCIGLFKKVIVADTCSLYSDAGYNTLQGGHSLDPASAAIAVLAFSLQIYYDFSGYSDMAVGLARMLGFSLPINFFSPYRSTGFIDFWRRWHITLSRFLRDYLYIPFGGNRKGLVRQTLNLIVVMVLGGLWHGANWTFIAWGMIHGTLLGVNHGWTKLRISSHPWLLSRLSRTASVLLTFALVTLAWIPFRAQSFGQAWEMVSRLFAIGAAPGTLQHSYQIFLAAQFGDVHRLLDITSWIKPKELWPPILPPDFLSTSRPVGLTLLILTSATFLLPNTYQLFARFDPALGIARFQSTVFGNLRRLGWGCAFVFSGIFVLSVLHLNHVTPFLYFQF